MGEHFVIKHANAFIKEFMLVGQTIWQCNITDDMGSVLNVAVEKPYNRSLQDKIIDIIDETSQVDEYTARDNFNECTKDISKINFIAEA